MEHISHIYRNLNWHQTALQIYNGDCFYRTVCETDLIQNIIQDSDKRYFHSRNMKSSYEKVNIVKLSCGTQF